MSVAPFRIAIRHEGKFVNAYFAPISSMENAVLMGSILRQAITDDSVFDAFLATMKQALTCLMRDVAEIDPAQVSYNVEVAPEHERSGHG